MALCGFLVIRGCESVPGSTWGNRRTEFFFEARLLEPFLDAAHRPRQIGVTLGTDPTYASHVGCHPALNKPQPPDTRRR